MYKEIEGNLITMAQAGLFDVICHGCNCFNRQKSGVAKQMVEAFGTCFYPLEKEKYYGDINKLGQIDYDWITIFNKHNERSSLYIVNCYIQFKIAKFNNIDYEYTTTEAPFDYQAFALCLKKINHIFKGRHIGMPMVGTHLAKGNWSIIKPMIEHYLTAVDVTVVIYKQS